MTDWVPALASIEGPRYLAFVVALEADIASGRVKPGMRLLPQRDMAQRLELSVGTISKAYAEAEQRGLISGEVGAMRLRPSRGRHRCIRADPGESRSRVYRTSGARSLLHADAANTDGNGDAAAAAASHRRDRSQA